MPGLSVWSRPLADRHTIVDMLPVLWGSIGGIDAERLDGLDGLQHLFDLGPSGNLQQTFAAWAHIRHGDVALAGHDRAQDIDARQGGSVLVPSPADEGEDASRLKGNDAPLAVDDVLIDASTEADSVLHLLPDPKELDMREFAHAVPRGLGGNSRESRSRSISATVIPRRKAAL